MAKRNRNYNPNDKIHQRRLAIVAGADQVCTKLEISSYSPNGYVLYSEAKKLLESGHQVNQAVGMLRQHDRLAMAREENKGHIELSRKERNRERAKSSAIVVRHQNQMRWNEARAAVTSTPSKGLTFGVSMPGLPNSKSPLAKRYQASMTGATTTPAVEKPIVEVANKETPNKSAPVAMPSGLLVASGKKVPGKHIFNPEEMASAVRKHIPGALIPDFRKYVLLHNQDGKTPHELARDFMAVYGSAANAAPVKEEEKVVSNQTRHTLQVVRMPGEVIEDLGQTSIFAWLESKGYDTTNHSNQRKRWASMGGWHVKCCEHTKSGEQHFWMISFDGQGGELLAVKSQRDYMSAYRYLRKQGMHPHDIEKMQRGEMYQAYNAARKAAAPAPVVKSAPKFIELHDSHVLASRLRRAARLRKLREVAQREGQGKFRTNVLANYDVCAITGCPDRLAAAHIVPDCSHDYMHASNGIALVNYLHAAFDDLMFSINPLTLKVFVDPAHRQFLNIHGMTVRDGKIWKLDRSALAHHWERFKEANCLEDAA